MEYGNKDLMIRVSGVEKRYRLGQIGGGTLQKDLQTWWALKHGREDPNSPVGQGDRITEGNLYALRDVSLDVYKGECLGIIGGNGAGKSTLLKLLSRVTAPTRGTIDLYGRVTSMLEVGTGFHGEMTGIENIYMNGTILGMKKKEIDGILDQIVDFSEVREFIDTPVKRYSSGMYVKLAFSVAAHLASEIVIMDEVLAVGDIAFQRKCIDKMLQTVREEQRTILYVSHNMNTIRELCSRCVVMDEGRIIYNGEVDEAIRYYMDYLMNNNGDGTNLGEIVRRDKNLTGLCRITGIRAPENLVRSGVPLTFTIRLRASKAFDSLQIRMMVCSATGGVIGMTWSDPFPIREGEREVDLSFDTDPLAPGSYMCDFAVFEYRDNVQTRHDFLGKILSFKVEETVKYFGKEWTGRSWGSVRLKKLEMSGKAGEV